MESLILGGESPTRHHLVAAKVLDCAIDGLGIFTAGAARIELGVVVASEGIGDDEVIREDSLLEALAAR